MTNTTFESTPAVTILKDFPQKVSTEEIRAVTDSLRSSVGVSNANSDAVLKIVAASAYLVFLARKNNMNTIDGDIISFVNEYAPEEDIKGFFKKGGIFK